jgi:hypothetical protein
VKKITYKANVVYAIKPIVLFICSLADICLLFDIFVFGESRIRLKKTKSQLGKKILYFKKKYRSYRVYESIFPEVVKTMECIYFDESEGSAKES